MSADKLRPFDPEKKTVQERIDLARIDSAREYKDFIEEIYKEAYNNDQNPDEKIAKVIAKFAALSVKVSIDNDETSRRNSKIACFALWVAIGSFIVALLAFGVALIQVALDHLHM